MKWRLLESTCGQKAAIEGCIGAEWVQNYILERSLWLWSEDHSQSGVRENSCKAFAANGNINCLGWGRARVREWNGSESCWVGGIEGAWQVDGQRSQWEDEPGLSSLGGNGGLSEITEQGGGALGVSEEETMDRVMPLVSLRYSDTLMKMSSRSTDTGTHRFSALGFECSWGSWHC